MIKAIKNLFARETESSEPFLLTKTAKQTFFVALSDLIDKQTNGTKK